MFYPLLNLGLMLKLAFSLSELNVCFVNLFIETLLWGRWFLVVSLLILYHWVLGFVKLVIGFVVIIYEGKVWLSNNLRINIFLGYLWFQNNWLCDSDLFSWTSYCTYLFACLSRRIIDIDPINIWHLGLTFRPLFELCIFALIINNTLSCSWLYVWQILVSTTTILLLYLAEVLNYSIFILNWGWVDLIVTSSISFDLILILYHVVWCSNFHLLRVRTAGRVLTWVWCWCKRLLIRCLIVKRCSRFTCLWSLLRLTRMWGSSVFDYWRLVLYEGIFLFHLFSFKFKLKQSVVDCLNAIIGWLLKEGTSWNHF